MVLLELLEVVVKGDDIMASHFLVEGGGADTHSYTARLYKRRCVGGAAPLVSRCLHRLTALPGAPELRGPPEVEAASG